MNLTESFEKYRQQYLSIYPPPERPTVAAFDMRSILVSMFFILCLTIYAATRTASVVEKTEIASGYDPATAQRLAWIAVIGIEGMLLYMSITHTRSSKLYSQEHAKVLIILGGVVSALAGVSSGLGLVQAAWITGTGNFVNILLTLFLGVGATIMVWASGEFVGTAIHNFRYQQTEALEKWRQDTNVYESLLRERWDASPEKAAAVHDLELLRAQQEAEMEAARLRREAERDVLLKQAEYTRRHANYQREKGADLLGLGSPVSPPTPEANGYNQIELAHLWLKEHAEKGTWTKDSVPSARNIAHALQTIHKKSFSTGSTDKARSRFLEENFA